MKRKNKKLLTLILAGALCVSAVSGVAAMKGITSSAADDGKWELSEIFVKENNASFGVNEAKDAQFTFSNDSVIRIKKNLALKWYDGKDDAKYLNFKFAFANTNFQSVSFKVESASAIANADNKTINTIKFVNESGAVSAYVFNGEQEPAVVTKVPVDVAGKTIAVSLKGSETIGKFDVELTVGENAPVSIGSFVNVGANFAEYTASKMTPFAITAKMPSGATGDAAKTAVVLKEINGQSFGNIQEDGGKYYVTDNAAPVLVINEEVSGFLLGTKFSLNYKAVDVLQSMSLKDEKTYYQYDPDDVALADLSEKYKELDTDVTFLDTTYTKEDGTEDTVYRVDGKEYVSIKITLGDNRGDDGKKTYDLSWYANGVVTKNGVDYVIVDRNTDGPTYKNLVATKNESNDKGTNVADQVALDAAAKDFQEQLDKAAETVYVNADITLPSLEKLFADNNGYRNLKFTISYKTPGSEATKLSTNLAYNGLKLTVDHEGKYEFKVLANDKAGNKMEYYNKDGDLVKVDSTNVWDINEIPSFTFTIKNQGMQADPTTTATTTYRISEKDVGEKYTFSDVKIVGTKNVEETYKLYKIDMDKARAIQLDEDVLKTVTYANLATAVKSATNPDKSDYIGSVYLDAYASLLAAKLNAAVTKDMVKDCFVEIQEYDSRITEENNKTAWNAYNKYNWTIASQAFTAAETGNYVILADYWETEVPSQRVAAYKVINVEEKSDGTEGETTSWVEQNLVSVILFGVAGVLLIIVIVLLFVKPSDETLEDVDAKAAKKTAKEKKEKEDK